MQQVNIYVCDNINMSSLNCVHTEFFEYIFNKNDVYLPHVCADKFKLNCSIYHSKTLICLGIDTTGHFGYENTMKDNSMKII